MQALGVGLSAIGGGALIRSAFGWIGKELLSLGARYGPTLLAAAGSKVIEAVPGLVEKGVGFLTNKLFSGVGNSRPAKKPSITNGFEFAPRHRSPSKYEPRVGKKRKPDPAILAELAQARRNTDEAVAWAATLPQIGNERDRMRIMDQGNKQIPLSESIYVPGNVGQYLR